MALDDFQTSAHNFAKHCLRLQENLSDDPEAQQRFFSQFAAGMEVARRTVDLAYGALRRGRLDVDVPAEGRALTFDDLQPAAKQVFAAVTGNGDRMPSDPVMWNALVLLVNGYPDKLYTLNQLGNGNPIHGRDAVRRIVRWTTLTPKGVTVRSVGMGQDYIFGLVPSGDTPEGSAVESGS